MPRKVIYEARTERLEILDKHGRVDNDMMPDLSREQILNLYRWMQHMRLADIKALKLQRQGRIGTYGSIQGQEGAQAGLALALTSEDWIIPSFREHGVMMMQGVPLHLTLAYWKGDERGSRMPEGVNCLPVSIPVGSQHLHGVGIGLALKKLGKKAAAVTFGGDGSSSQGDFHEALNFAGVFQPNTLFFIQNNQWAISVPFTKQTAASSIAQKAHAYNIPGIQIDGQDVFASYAASAEALQRARNGEGPTLIEAFLYRYGDHTTADDASRYRDEEELTYWKKGDPINRLRLFLESEGLWDDNQESALQEELQAEVDVEVKKLEEMPAPGKEEMFDMMYESLPLNLISQKQQLLEEVPS